MSKKITFMIVPEGGERIFSQSMSLTMFKVVISLSALLILTLIGITIVYAGLAVKASRVSSLENENQKLRADVSRVNEIEKNYKKNRDLTVRLAEMAGVDISQMALSESYGSSETDIPDTNYNDTGTDSVDNSMIASSKPLSDTLAKIVIPHGRPLYGWITRPFTSDKDTVFEKHSGIDFAVKEGTSVLATASGTVSYAGWDKELGNLVIIDHGNGFQTLYGHNKKMLVEKGQKVLKGDVIALSGNTGNSSAPHLHYEIRKDGQPVNPASYLD